MTKKEASDKIRQMYSLKAECRRNIKNCEQVIRDCDLIIEECTKFLKSERSEDGRTVVKSTD